MKNKLIATIAVIATIWACTKNTKITSDRSNYLLNGDVKTITRNIYLATESSTGEEIKELDEFWITRFNEEGAIIEFEKRYADSSLIEKRIYTIGSNGKRETGTTYNDQNNIIAKTSFYYDKNGNNTIFVKVDPNGEIIVRDSSAYDQNNNLIYDASFDKNGHQLSKKILTYNSENQNIKNSFYNSDGTLDYYVNYFDFSPHKTFGATNVYNALDSLVLKANAEFIYDSNNNWISKKVYEDGELKRIELRTVEYFSNKK